MKNILEKLDAIISSNSIDEIKGIAIEIRADIDNPIKLNRKKRDFSEEQVLFETFWAKYPNKERKSKAFQRFIEFGCAHEMDRLMLALSEYNKILEKSPGRFPKMAEGWLNKGLWEDYLPINVVCTDMEGEKHIDFFEYVSRTSDILYKRLIRHDNRKETYEEFMAVANPDNELFLSPELMERLSDFLERKEEQSDSAFHRWRSSWLQGEPNGI